MLPRLQAELQLHAIEAATVPHMKAEDAKRVTSRYRRHLEDRSRPRNKSAGMASQLLEAFQAAGFEVERTQK